MTQRPTIEPFYDAVILGAGTAGIAAARTLKAQGYENILVVEGRDRMGGRVHYDPIYQDLGGAWSHISDVRLHADPQYRQKLRDIRHNLISEAGKRGFHIHWDNRQDSRIYWDGKRVPSEQYFKYLTFAFNELNEIHQQHGDMTIADAFQHMQTRDDFMEWVLCMEFGWGSTGRDHEGVSLEAGLKHLALDSGLLYKEGLGSLITALGEDIADKTAFNTRVTGLYQRGTHTPYPQVELETADGKTHTVRAKCVLNTIPPSVIMQPGEHAIAHDLPEWKTKALQALPSGAMNKIILAVKPEFLKQKNIPNSTHYEVLNSQLDNNMFFLACPAGHPVVVAFVGGAKSIELEKGSDEDARAYALQYLTTIPDFADIGDHIDSVHFTRWHQDPFARGAYSTPVVGAADAREKAFEPVDDKLFFAGEACAHGGWETHVYGAYETGMRAAELMIERALARRPHLELVTRPTAPDTNRRVG